MTKNILSLAAIAISGILLVSCATGASGSATITATSSNCSPITNAKQCTITLNYNTNNVSGLSLGVSYSPQQYSQFTLSLNSCPAPSSSGGAQTCTIPVSYVSTGSAVTQNLVFTLGGVNSNSVTVSGN